MAHDQRNIIIYIYQSERERERQRLKDTDIRLETECYEPDHNASMPKHSSDKAVINEMQKRRREGCRETVDDEHPKCTSR